MIKIVCACCEGKGHHKTGMTCAICNGAGWVWWEA